MWGSLHYRTWLVYSNDEPTQKSSRSSSASELDAHPLVPLESFHSSYVHLLHGNLYYSHHVYHLAFSCLWLSSLMWAIHTFLSSSSTIILFHHLSVNFLAYAHPLHECSKYRSEWISLTCTWLVVSGRVKIRFKRRPCVKIYYIEFSTRINSIFML